MAEQQSVQTTTTTEQKPVDPVQRPTAGAGVQALQQLLGRGGTPAPDAVVAIVDAHRGERDQIFTILQTTLGNAYVQQVVASMDRLRASIARREVVDGDPSNPKSGYFEASQAEGGARWRTQDGSFTGTANKDGLDSRYQVDPSDAAHAKVDKTGAGSLAWEHDGRDEGELYERYKSGSDWEAGARRTDPLAGGSLTYGARHQVTATGANDGVSGEYTSTDKHTTLGGTAALQGGHAIGDVHGSERLAGGGTIAGNAGVGRETQGQTETIAGSYKDPETQISGSVTHHDANDRVTGNLTASHQLDPQMSISGSITRAADRTTITSSATDKLSGQQTIGGSLGYTSPDHGKGQGSLALTDRYRSNEVVSSLGLDAGLGARDYATATGSVDAKLGNDLYGGGFGSYTTEAGKHDTSKLGASLTFTPNEKAALTLAGVIDQTGALETRLQLDVFKQKIAGVGDLADHKKDALVSLFVSYTTGGKPGMLNDQLGAPQANYERAGSEGQVMAGIRIKF